MSDFKVGDTAIVKDGDRRELRIIAIDGTEAWVLHDGVRFTRRLSQLERPKITISVTKDELKYLTLLVGGSSQTRFEKYLGFCLPDRSDSVFTALSAACKERGIDSITPYEPEQKQSINFTPTDYIS